MIQSNKVRGAPDTLSPWAEKSPIIAHPFPFPSAPPRAEELQNGGSCSSSQAVPLNDKRQQSDVEIGGQRWMDQ